MAEKKLEEIVDDIREGVNIQLEDVRDEFRISDSQPKKRVHELIDNTKEVIKTWEDRFRPVEYYLFGQPVLDFKIEVDSSSLAESMGLSHGEIFRKKGGIYRTVIPHNYILSFHVDNLGTEIHFVPGASDWIEEGTNLLRLHPGAKYINSDPDKRVFYTNIEEAVGFLANTYGLERRDIKKIQGGIVEATAGGNIVNTAESLLKHSLSPYTLDKIDVKLCMLLEDDSENPLHRLLEKKFGVFEKEVLSDALPVSGLKHRWNLEFVPNIFGTRVDRTYIGDAEGGGDSDDVGKYIDDTVTKIINQSDDKRLMVLDSTTNQSFLYPVLNNIEKAVEADVEVVLSPSNTMMRTAGRLMEGTEIKEAGVYGDQFRKRIHTDRGRGLETRYSSLDPKEKELFKGAWLLSKKIRWDRLICNRKEFELLLSALPRFPDLPDNPDIYDMMQYNSRHTREINDKKRIYSVFITEGSTGFQIQSMQTGNEEMKFTGMNSRLPEYEPYWLNIGNTGGAGDYTTGAYLAMAGVLISARTEATLAAAAGSIRASRDRDNYTKSTIGYLLADNVFQHLAEMDPSVTIVEAVLTEIGNKHFVNEYGEVNPILHQIRGEEIEDSRVTYHFPSRKLPSAVTDIGIHFGICEYEEIPQSQ